MRLPMKMRQHKVSELNAWAKLVHDTEEVKALCQS